VGGGEAALDALGGHRAHALARTLLDRHGVVTRGAVAAEGIEGGFSATYRVLSVFEESGQARRGYVVEGLGAAQFAMDGAVDRLRAVANARDRGETLPNTDANGFTGSQAGTPAPGWLSTERPGSAPLPEDSFTNTPDDLIAEFETLAFADPDDGFATPFGTPTAETTPSADSYSRPSADAYSRGRPPHRTRPMPSARPCL
ncbi:DEAD/DEAH box helicase, partial [Streptomyces ipomoeae]|nr:DEAD/DEAH box helicase [Streptomyces ipomoeae]